MRSKIPIKVNPRFIKPSIKPSSPEHKVIRKNIFERYPSTSNFIGVLIGAVFTLLALLYTIRFSTESFDFSKKQYEELKEEKRKLEIIALKEKSKADKKDKEREERNKALELLRNEQTEKQIIVFKKQASIAESQLRSQIKISNQSIIDNSPLVLPSIYSVALDTATKRYKLTLPLTNSGKRIAFKTSASFYFFNTKTGFAYPIPVEKNPQELFPSGMFEVGFMMDANTYNSDDSRYAVKLEFIDPPISKQSIERWIYFKLNPKSPDRGITLPENEITRFKNAVGKLKE